MTADADRETNTVSVSYKSLVLSREVLPDIVIIAVGFAYAILIFVGSFRYTIDARLFPLVASSIGIVGSIAFMASTLRAARAKASEGSSVDTDETSVPPTAGGPSVYVAFLGIGAGLVVLYVLGVYSLIVLYTLLYGVYGARMTWRQAVGLTFGLLLLTYLLFERVMGLDMWGIGLIFQ